jgi:hypothetical protein
MSASFVADNPFYVLAVPVTASRLEIERAGQKLLSMLELGLAGAATYQTPLGAQPRTADAVRQAMADLRDPDRRVVAEALAGLPPEALPAVPALPPWAGARAALGWGPPSSR